MSVQIVQKIVQTVIKEKLIKQMTNFQLKLGQIHNQIYRFQKDLSYLTIKKINNEYFCILCIYFYIMRGWWISAAPAPNSVAAARAPSSAPKHIFQGKCGVRTFW